MLNLDSQLKPPSMKSNLFVAIAILVSSVSTAQKNEVFSTAEGAIRGYDPVAYFTENKPVKGHAQFKTEWKGQVWHFASQKNLTAFTSSPESYAPQYGGFCAFNMSKGYKASTDPYAYNIIDGKLYLTNSRSVQDDWNKQRQHHIHRADQNWPTVKSKEM
jgi:YHS domain-containing protein